MDRHAEMVWQVEHSSDQEPAMTLAQLLASSRDKVVFEHPDVYRGLPILRGHSSLKEKASHYSHPRYSRTHFAFWRTLASCEEALDPRPLLVSDLIKPLNHPGSSSCKLWGLRTSFMFSWRAVRSGVGADPCWMWERKPAFPLSTSKRTDRQTSLIFSYNVWLPGWRQVLSKDRITRPFSVP